MSVVIGVDIGSSATRAVALDRDGLVLGHASARYEGVKTWAIGYADPSKWLAALERALDELAGVVPEARRPAAIAIGGQSPTTVAADSSMALTYQHPAGVEDGFDGQHAAQRSLIQEHHPDAAVAQAWDWALMQLGAPHSQGAWPGLDPLDGFGVPFRTGEVVGQADGRFGVEAGTLLVPGAQDMILACWASGLDQPGRACDPGGRTGGLFVAGPSDAVPGGGTFAMDSPAEGVSIFGGPVSAHGRAMEWLSRITGRSIDELLQLAEESPVGAGGVRFLPYLAGERVPRWSPNLRGEFVGLSLETGPGDLARAVLEGTAYGLAHIAQLLAESGVPMEVLVSTGSPSKSSLWCEIKASVLGVPVETSEFTELSAFGAGLAAGAGAGWWPAPGTSKDADWPRPPMSIVQPVPDPSYSLGLARFIALGDESESRLVQSKSATSY